jgi:hypothetical protein
MNHLKMTLPVRMRIKVLHGFLVHQKQTRKIIQIQGKSINYQAQNVIVSLFSDKREAGDVRRSKRWTRKFERHTRKQQAEKKQKHVEQCEPGCSSLQKKNQ